MSVEMPDPVAIIRGVLVSRQPGSPIAGVPVRDEREEGDEPPFILLAQAGALRHRSVGALLPARVSLTGVGATPGAAAVLYRTASDLLHRLGPIHEGTAGIWRIYDETGQQRPVQEPDTAWWRSFGVFDLYMADRAIG